jgi:hypothetical protein
MRIVKALAVLIVAAGITFVPSWASAAPAGGAIEVWVTPSLSNSPTSPIVVTGAIGDYGKSTSHTKAGKADSNGNYVTISLQKGSFQVNSVALNEKANKAQPTLNSSTCSAYLSVSGPVTVSAGTGAYQGISGTITITESFAFVGPRFASGAKKGQCDQSNSAKPLAQYGQLTGVGTVSFS